MDSRSSLVSVIVPVHNGERFVTEALQSILGQDYQPLEVIVVDDGSTDRTLEIVGKYAERVIRVSQPQAGPSAARNHGLKLAAGDFVAFLDADDWWPADALCRLIAPLLSDSMLQLVLGYSRRVWTDPAYKAKDAGRFGPYPDFTVRFPLMGNFIARRSVFAKVGSFDTDLTNGEDTDWFIRVFEAGIPIQHLDEIVHLYRQHENNISRRLSDSEMRLLMVKLARRSIHRRTGRPNRKIQSA